MGVSALMSLVPLFVVGCILFIPLCPQPDECNTYWGKFPFALLKWLCIPFFFFLVTGVVVANEAKQYFAEHFDQYKCKPWFMPFVSFVRGDVSTKDNFIQCTAEISKMSQAVLAAPLINATQKIGTGMNTANETLNKLQRDHMNMAQGVIQNFERRQQEADAHAQLGTYMFIKLKAVLDKAMAMVFDAYYALVSLMDLINIMLALPELIIKAIRTITAIWFSFFLFTLIMGIVFSGEALAALVLLYLAPLAPFLENIAMAFFAISGNFFVIFLLMLLTMAVPLTIAQIKADHQADPTSCFDSHTNVVLNTGDYVPISRIKVGDSLKGEIRVLGTFRCKSVASDWYQIRTAPGQSLQVTGTHLWQEPSSRMWKRVDEWYAQGVKSITKIDNTKTSMYRYCLVTDKHLIPTICGWFADYQESNQPEDLAQDAMISLQSLNPDEKHVQINPELEKGERAGGFDAIHTWVKTLNDWKQMKDVQIGDILENGHTVAGVYLGAADECNKDSWIPPDQILWDPNEKRWAKKYSLHLPQVSKDVQTTTLARTTMHLVTSSGTITVGFGDQPPVSKHHVYIVRDFYERPHE